jgi:hypothetical protein
MPADSNVLQKIDRYGANLPFLISVTAPADVDVGEYETTVEAQVGDRNITTPLRVTVLDYVLPRQSHFRTALFALGHQPSHMPPQFTDEYETWARDFMTYLAERRISHDGPLPYVWRDFTTARREAGQPEIDVTTADWQSKFIEWADFWKERGLHVNNIFPYGMPTGGERFNHFLETYGRLLAEHGWLEEAFCRTIPDEFDARGTGGAQSVIEYARAVRRVVPGLRLSSTAMKPDQLTLQMMASAGTDIWMIHERVLEHSEENQAFFENELARGKPLWLYVHQEQTLGTPPTAVRWWFLRSDARGVTGCVLWNITWWHRSGAKWRDGAVHINILEETEGCLFWPGEEGLLPSLRLEHLRDGMEDIERLWLLKQSAAAWLQEHPESSAPPDPVRGAVTVVDEVHRIALDDGATHDLPSLAELRLQIDSVLEALNDAGLLVAQE